LEEWQEEFGQKALKQKYGANPRAQMLKYTSKHLEDHCMRKKFELQ